MKDLDDVFERRRPAPDDSARGVGPRGSGRAGDEVVGSLALAVVLDLGLGGVDADDRHGLVADQAQCPGFALPAAAKLAVVPALVTRIFT